MSNALRTIRRAVNRKEGRPNRTGPARNTRGAVKGPARVAALSWARAENQAEAASLLQRMTGAIGRLGRRLFAGGL